MNADVQAICERFSALKQIRAPWESLWTEIAQYVMPRRVPGMQGTVMSPTTENESRLFDTTAVHANMTLANGQLAWMSPLESSWFAFEPGGKGSDEAKRWLADATTTAREEMAISNFYTAIHEFYLDRSAFGTAALYVEPGQKTSINCSVWPVGTFVVDEDQYGMVDTVGRELKLTARQAEQRFGRGMLSPKVLKQLTTGGAQIHEKTDYLHFIYPRADSERSEGKMDDVNMPIASIYIEIDSKHVCKESGYEEMPVMVSRYLEWGSGLGALYGWSPSFAALPEARQVNVLQKMMDALAEKIAFPPVLAPEELEGEIDANALGVTYFARDMTQLPREWMTGGRYDVGLDRIKERQQAIKDAFHVELFSMFAQIEKQMTAREVAERSQEKLIQFSPTFARLTGECFNPCLERIFNILVRNGKLAEIPQDLQGQPYRIQYSSRIALALRALPTIGYSRTLERIMAMAPLVPDVLDNYDLDEAERTTALADGVPPDFLRSETDRDEIRAARAQMQAQAAQAEQAQMAADAAAKVGGIPPESPVGNVISGALGVAA